MNPVKRFVTLLNLHLAAVAVLLCVVLVLGVKALLAVHDAGSADSADFQRQQLRYTQLRAQMAHLEGLPEKVDQARDDEAAFFTARIAPNYSTIAEELGVIEVRDQVRLIGAHYAQAPAIDGLTEIRIDANLSGDYAPLMHFINDLERDKNHVFFIIDGITLTGQQGGQVGLRLRMTTYIQAGATDLPADSPPSESGSDSAASTGARPAYVSGNTAAAPTAETEVR